MDLEDLEHNTRDGLHIASLAGAWMALVAGFGGMRHTWDRLEFSPRLPEEISRLAFTMQFRGRHLRVEITATTATYTLSTGEPLEIRHYGDCVTVHGGAAEARAIPAVVAAPTPEYPPGRRPNAAGQRR